MLRSSAGKGFRVFRTNTRKGFLDFQDHFSEVKVRRPTTTFSLSSAMRVSVTHDRFDGFCLQGPGGGHYMPAFVKLSAAF